MALTLRDVTTRFFKLRVSDVMVIAHTLDITIDRKPTTTDLAWRTRILALAMFRGQLDQLTQLIEVREKARPS